MNLFDLSGRVALITGSSRGIGLVLASGLAEAGARVVLNGRDEARLSAAVADLKQHGVDATPLVFDVADPAAAERAVAGIESAVGPIDILVNNAGMQHRQLLQDFPDDKWHEIFRANVDSVFFMARAVAQRMIPRGRGKIINIASVTSELARSTIVPYGATKGAVRQLTRGMACDWARHGLQINAIAPGYFRTELNTDLFDDPPFTDWLAKRTPAGRAGRIEELIGAAVFLASDASSFVNGHILYVDGGMTASV